MKRIVQLPTTADGRKRLTPDQRNLLIILEDATLMFVRDEVRFLQNLPEVLHGGDNITRVLLVEILDTIQKRIREIRRGWGDDKTEMYEAALLTAVDDCDGARHDLKREIQAALAQKVRWQDIRRAEHIATASGLTDSAARIHEWITGRKHKYDGIRERLGEIDERLECRLLNEGRLPEMGEAQLAFARLFDSLCTAVLERFTTKEGKEDVR